MMRLGLMMLAGVAADNNTREMLGQACPAAVTHDQDCDGADIDTVHAESTDECCAACASSDACGAFVFVAGGSYPNRCYLKSSCTLKDGCGSGTCTAGVMPTPAPTPSPPTPPPTPSPPTPPNSYFFILGDWGVARGTHGHQCQQDVADKMKTYAKAQGTSPLLVASVGDNFYAAGLETEADWTNMWSNVYGPNDTSSGLYDVPWYSVLGNHDMGNDDPKCACGTCKQFDSYPGRPEETKLYNMPDYNWYKEFPSANLEVIGVESNTVDDNGLGGNGWAGGSAAVPGACGMSVDQVKQFLRRKYEEGLALVEERARNTTASTVLIIQHYPKYSNAPQELVAAFKKHNKKATVISAYGHDHSQECQEGPESQCEHILSGGGGGYGPAGMFGFVAVHLDGMGGYSTKITDPDVTVHPDTCAVCSPWMSCLWSTSSNGRSEEMLSIWYYVIGLVVGILVVAVAVALVLRCRARRASETSTDGCRLGDSGSADADHPTEA